MVSLSVIVPFYNEENLLENSVNRLLENNIYNQIILIDNNSTDNSDFIKYIENLSLISVSKIFTISLFLLLFSIYIVAFIDKGTKRK